MTDEIPQGENKAIEALAKAKPWAPNTISMFLETGYPPPEMLGCDPLKAHRRWLATLQGIANDLS